MATPTTSPSKPAAAPQKAPFETPADDVRVTQLPPEAAATDVSQLDNEAFKKALNLDEVIGQEPAPETTQETEQTGGGVAGAPAAETPAEAAAGQQPAPEQEAAPVEQPEREIPPLGREPETPFSVHDAAGELEIPDVRISFKANGREYDKVPLDKVVRFAQMGIYNAEKERTHAETTQRAKELETGYTELQRQVRDLESYSERLLADPPYYERAAELYSEHNTPEHRIARAERQATELRAQMGREREDRELDTFVRYQLAPAFERLLQQHPLVKKEEVVGQYTLLTAPLLDRGRVPLSRLAELKALVDQDLSQWVRSIQDERSLDGRRTQEQVQAAKTQAALAKRQVARAAVPKGTAAPVEAPRPKKYESVQDWLKDGGGVVPPYQEQD